jgi:predicted ATPase
MGFNAEGGSRNFNFNTRPSHSALYKAITAERGIKRPRDGYFLRAESFYNLATEIERLDSNVGLTYFPPPVIDSYGGGGLHEQSHGESFFALLNNRLRGNGLYIFDEPEAALSPRRQMSLLTLMHGLVKKSSQFIISTHSPILLAYPNAQIYSLTTCGMKKIRYTETEHFQITRDFLNRHEKMLEILLKE